MLLIYLFIFTFLISPLYPILDGFASPIYLENRYTFTNYEFARGHVYFKNGFDLPLNGTVILNILEPVNGYIQSNRSTILFQRSLVLGQGASIKGDCFLLLNNNTLEFSSDQFLSAGDRLFCCTTGEIRGQDTTIFNPGGGALIFCGGAFSQNVLSNMTLDGPTNKNFVGLAGNPNILTFSNMSIILKESLTISSFSISLRTLTTVNGLRGSVLTCSDMLRLDSFADISIGSGLTLKLKKFASQGENGSLILDNAALEFYGTTTSLFVFVKNTLAVTRSAGKIKFRGPSSIRTNPVTQLFLSSDSILELEPGARCTFAPGTNIKFY